MSGSSLWGRDRATVWAIHSCTGSRRNRRSAPKPGTWWDVKYYDRMVTTAAPKCQFGWGTRARKNRLTHMPAVIYLAWRRGVYKGAMVRWRCGATCTEFKFADEPGQDMKICPTCLLAASGGLHALLETIARVDITVEKGGRLRIG